MLSENPYEKYLSPKISDEHLRLADIIKSTHSNLRKQAETLGAKEAWNKHVENKDLLKLYSTTMNKLANEHWATAPLTRPRARCRIKWTIDQIKEYFTIREELLTHREADIKSKLDPEFDEIKRQQFIHSARVCSHDNKIKVLDVGSCYNPFSEDTSLEVTAIDIAAACSSVLKCDFLGVDIGSSMNFENGHVDQLPCDYYDVVVFSLFLEYLPCPEQRFSCCVKAYNLLRSGGVLIIITPDSKHVNANSKLMKSWRVILSRIGMMRIRYEKFPHMHCIVYRKCFLPEVTQRWEHLQTLTEDVQTLVNDSKMYIPQDLQDGIPEKPKVEESDL